MEGGRKDAHGGVEQFELIRKDYYGMGLSVRAIARKHGVHRRRVELPPSDRTPFDQRRLERGWLDAAESSDEMESGTNRGRLCAVR